MLEFSLWFEVSWKLLSFNNFVSVEGQKSVRMQVHAIPESGTFIMKRFCPEINNVRSHWFKGLDNAKNIPEKGKLQ